MLKLSACCFSHTASSPIPSGNVFNLSYLKYSLRRFLRRLISWRQNRQLRRGSRGGEMGEFSPPFFWAPFFLFSFLFLKYWNNIWFLWFLWLRWWKFTPHFKILDPRLQLVVIHTKDTHKYCEQVISTGSRLISSLWDY